MGNIFYSLLTKLYPFEHVKTKDAQEKIMTGERPFIDPKFTNSTKSRVQAMLKAIDMCWIQDPRKRASAREVASFLKVELKKIAMEDSHFEGRT